MIRIVKSFCTLSSDDRKLTLVMAPRLLCTVIELRLFGFNHCHSRVRDELPSVPRTITNDELEAVSVAIRRVSNGLKIGTCLSRSLALRAHLTRKGVCTSLRIGVNKPDNAFKAHAWLEYEGEPIGENVPPDYSVLPELR